MIIVCPSCERDIAVPRSAISRRAICPLCSESFIVELPRAIVIDETEETPEPAPAPEEPAREAEKTGEAEEAAEAVEVKETGQAEEAEEAPETEQAEETEEAQETEEIEEPQWPQETEETEETRWIREPEEPEEPEGAEEAAPAAPQPAGPTTAPHVWYVQTRDGELGPMHIVQVAKAAWMGKISRNTRLRRSGSDKTIHAGDLPGIFPEKPAPQGETASSDGLTDYLAGLAKQASKPAKADAPKKADSEGGKSPKGGDPLADLVASQQGDDEPDEDSDEDAD